MKKWMILLFMPMMAFSQKKDSKSWIRINQLGYTLGGVKVAVWGSREEPTPGNWQLVDVRTNAAVFSGKAGKSFGAYGPFSQTCRLNFTAFTKKGRYYLQ